MSFRNEKFIAFLFFVVITISYFTIKYQKKIVHKADSDLPLLTLQNKKISNSLDTESVKIGSSTGFDSQSKKKTSTNSAQDRHLASEPDTQTMGQQELTSKKKSQWKWLEAKKVSVQMQSQTQSQFLSHFPRKPLRLHVFDESDRWSIF